MFDCQAFVSTKDWITISLHTTASLNQTSQAITEKGNVTCTLTQEVLLNENNCMIHKHLMTLQNTG